MRTPVLTLSTALCALMTPLFGQTAAPAKPAEPAKPATEAKATPPPPSAIRPFAFPKYATQTLPNGLTLYVVEDHRQPAVAMQLVVNAGNIAAPAAKAGLADMTASLLRQGGTKTRTSQDIAQAVDRVGGSLGAGANDDTASVTAVFTKSNADLGLELMADIVLNPAFAQEEIDRLRRQALSGLQVQYTDPKYIAPLAAARVLYGQHPYAYPGDGTPDTLRSITRDDLVQFHQQRYTPQNAFLVFAGDITPADAAAKAQQRFGVWKAAAGAVPAATAPPAAQRRVVLVDKPDAVQTEIVVGQTAIPRNHPDYIPLLIANQIFGGSFNSRLNMKLRANEGLTYGANSGFDTGRVAGVFTASTFTRTEKTADAIRMLIDLLKEFQASPGTPQEINEAKAYIAGSFAIGTETAAQVAGRVLTAAIHGLPAGYWDRYREMVMGTTPEQIAAAVRKHLNPETVTIVAVGNTKEFTKALEPYGTVRTVALADFDPMAADLTRPKQAAPAATAETSARGKALVAAAAEAMGGGPALDAVKDLTAKATMKLTMPQGSMDGTVTETLVYPDKYRVVLALPMGEITQAYDGKTAWVAQGAQSQAMPAAFNAEMARSIQLAGGIGLMRDALAGRAEIVALPAVEMDGKKMDALQVKSGDQPITVLLDPQTHLITQVAFRGLGMQGPAETEARFSDYRVVSGLKLPHKVSVKQNGQPYMEQTYTGMSVNSGVKAEGFSKP